MACRLIGLAILAVACRATPPRTTGAPAAREDPAAAPRPPVGITSRVYVDTARGRRLPVTIWYPAPAGTVEETTNFDGIFPGRGAWDAPLRAGSARVPLVLLSHGSGGDASNLAWLAEAFAAQGWIAAAVDHPGDRFGDQTPEGRFAVWRRAPDLSMALTELLADYTFGPRIDRRRVAAAGHSSGGLAVLLLAGVRLRPSDFLASCTGPRPGPDCALIAGLDVSAIPDLDRAGDRYRDRRIRAVAAMAPVMGLAATAASLRAVDVPVAIVGLPNDELVPFDRNAARYARLIRHAQLTTVPGAGHFVFMPVCTLPGRLVAAAVCVDIATSPDRAAVHDTTAATLVRFFERTLGAR